MNMPTGKQEAESRNSLISMLKSRKCARIKEINKFSFGKVIEDIEPNDILFGTWVSGKIQQEGDAQ